MENRLRPCPFCGNIMNGYPDYTISFKHDSRKRYGVVFTICKIHCNKCTCTISQAGCTKEEAEKHALNLWNKRFMDEVTE